jgi:PAS domain S-box-containing protein
MRRFLEASGQIGRDLLAVDWDATPLGQPEEWPPALRNSVRILLTSRFSMWMAWGPELTFFCNDAYRHDTLGKKYPWALGKPASQVWLEIWDDIGPRIDHVMHTGESTWDESLLLFLTRSGYVEETYHTFSYSPLADDDGEVAGLLCVVKEDTEQVISARRIMTLRDLGTRSSELTEAETIASTCERLGLNQRSLPFTLVYLFDADGRSAVRAGMTGFAGAHPAAPATLVVGEPESAWPVTELVHGSPVVVDGIDRRFTDLPCGDWEEPPTQAFVVPLVQPRQPAPYGFLVVGMNRYRPLDEPYRDFVQLIAGHLAASITDARAFEFEKQRAESLARIDRAKTDFFTNVSHEFRTPLTLLLGPAEDALADAEDPLSPGQRERLTVVNRNAQRLLKLVNNLLDFSRLESGKVTSRFEQLDLAGYTAELATMFESAAIRAGLTLSIDCQPLSVRPYVDQDQWAKIVLNLVSNALKFTFEGGITVRLAEEAGAAVLTVSDTGIGIPPSELPYLFERFHRVPGARSRTHEGSGIGLALVQELTALHGGTVTATSSPGEGTTFTVRVPPGTTHLPSEHVQVGEVDELGEVADVARRAQEFVVETLRWLSDDAPSEPDRRLPARPTGGDGPRGRVLVVEDNADMRDYIAGLLQSEYDVETAADGLAALARVQAVAPDLILTDVMMPRLDGFGLLKQLHADPATMGIPVIMLSARAGEEGTLEGLEAGADDYLVKPFSARELRARVAVNMELDKVRRVRATLERSQSLLDQAQRLAKVGSWEVDLTSNTVTASDELGRLMERSPEDIASLGYHRFVDELVHPDDRAAVRTALEQAAPDSQFSYDARVLLPSGAERVVSVHGEVVASQDGVPRVLRGSVQDITDQRLAEQTIASAAALEEAASREHTIADELQRSLLPERSFEIEHLDVATYYRAGVEGTQVGGDWYDIIELGAGRTAFVVGDVMGRGVTAAAVMGQLRSAVRAFAKLDLQPAEILEYLDGIVQDMDGDQIVTCVYAIFDSTDQILRYATAGHLPPLLSVPGQPTQHLDVSGPPLGAGYFGMQTESVALNRGSTVTFYTDGLVERRNRDIDVGVDSLAELLTEHASTPLAGLPELLVDRLLPDAQDDDIAILMTRVNADPFEAAVAHRLSGEEPRVVATSRRVVADHLRDWAVSEELVDEVVLMASELVTNAFVHGRGPIDLRLRRTGSEVILEVQDRAAYRPRRRRAEDDDEHGRGLMIVSVLADRWGSRATGTGKAVWFSRLLSHPTRGPG